MIRLSYGCDRTPTRFHVAGEHLVEGLPAAARLFVFVHVVDGAFVERFHAVVSDGFRSVKPVADGVAVVAHPFRERGELRHLGVGDVRCLEGFHRFLVQQEEGTEEVLVNVCAFAVFGRYPVAVSLQVVKVILDGFDVRESRNLICHDLGDGLVEFIFPIVFFDKICEFLHCRRILCVFHFIKLCWFFI